jgi:hypothetical protein
MANRPTGDSTRLVVLEQTVGPHLYSGDLRPCTVLPGSRGLTGDVVYDAAGDYVGRIEEVMVDTRIGYVAYAVITAGGFLGIGKRRFAVPWSIVKPDPHARRCAVNIDHHRLLGAPWFNGYSN